MKRSANACGGGRGTPRLARLADQWAEKCLERDTTTGAALRTADRSGGSGRQLVNSDQVSSPLTRYQPLISMIPIKIVVIFLYLLLYGCD